jgi:hypothetical protein
MIRTLLGVLGVALALFPDRVLEWYEGVAFEAPEAATAKPWVPNAIRVEGILYALLCVTGGAAYAWLVRLVAAVGAVVAVVPRRYLDIGGRIAYEQPSELRWREEFVTAVRGLGVVCVALGLRALRNRGSGASDTEA